MRLYACRCRSNERIHDRNGALSDLATVVIVRLSGLHTVVSFILQPSQLVDYVLFAFHSWWSQPTALFAFLSFLSLWFHLFFCFVVYLRQGGYVLNPVHSLVCWLDGRLVGWFVLNGLPRNLVEGRDMGQEPEKFSCGSRNHFLSWGTVGPLVRHAGSQLCAKI